MNVAVIRLSMRRIQFNIVAILVATFVAAVLAASLVEKRIEIGRGASVSPNGEFTLVISHRRVSSLFKSKDYYIPKLIRLSDGKVVLWVSDNSNLENQTVTVPTENKQSIGFTVRWSADSNSATWVTPQNEVFENYIEIKANGNGMAIGTRRIAG